MTTGSGAGEGGRLGRAVDLLRRHPGALIVVAALGLVVVGLLNQASNDGGNEDTSDRGLVDERPARSAGNSDQEETAGGGDGAGTDNGSTLRDRPGTSGSTTTTEFPADVARPRPPVDLDTPPDGSDPVEVARWWTATYVAHVGAEPGEELARRLEPLTTPSLQQHLANVPPGASYNEPISIEGVTASEPASQDGGDHQGHERLRVVVETPDALVVYDIVMERGAAGWQVDEVTLL